MHIIYLGSWHLVSYWDHIQECLAPGEHLDCNQAYWMVPGTVLS